MCKFVEALATRGEADMPATEATVIDESTDPRKRQKVAKKCNLDAMANLTMAFTSAATMGSVDRAPRSGSQSLRCPS